MGQEMRARIGLTPDQMKNAEAAAQLLARIPADKRDGFVQMMLEELERLEADHGQERG